MRNIILFALSCLLPSVGQAMQKHALAAAATIVTVAFESPSVGPVSPRHSSDSSDGMVATEQKAKAAEAKAKAAEQAKLEEQYHTLLVTAAQKLFGNLQTSSQSIQSSSEPSGTPKKTAKVAPSTTYQIIDPFQGLSPDQIEQVKKEADELFEIKKTLAAQQTETSSQSAPATTPAPAKKGHMRGKTLHVLLVNRHSRGVSLFLPPTQDASTETTRHAEIKAAAAEEARQAELLGAKAAKAAKAKDCSCW